jgi:predicted Zn-dependent protease
MQPDVQTPIDSRGGPPPRGSASRRGGFAALSRGLRCAPIVAALLLAACVTNPVTGRSEFTLMSPERETALGQQAAKQVEREIGLVDAPELAAYVERLGQRLARNSPRRDLVYRFAVADMEEPNAFALPGGWIYVSRGLLTITNSEAELANVIGHEIGHVAARHAAQRETRAAGAGLLAALGGIAAGAVGGDAAGRSATQLGQLAGASVIAFYSRDQERQADEVGQKIAARSGYDPAALASFLGTLERESVQRSAAQRRPSFLDSHPLTGERVEATAARARGLVLGPAPPDAAGRAAFLAHLEDLVVGPDPAEGVFEAERFLHPGLGLTIDFPLGWRTQNRRDAVGAGAPSEDAFIVLEVQGPREDPLRAAQRFASASELPLSEGLHLRIGGWDAYRSWSQARSQSGEVTIDLTWIAHRDATLRVTGLAAASRFRVYAESFRATARSVRPLGSAERAGLEVRRLRIMRARRGERLAALSRRSGNVWSVAETAIANALPQEAELGKGELVKIAVEVPYER